MMIPPNHTAAELNNAPNAESTYQARLSTQQSVSRGGVLGEINNAQTGAAMMDGARAQESAQNTVSNAANALLAYKTTEMQKSAGVGGGKEEMFQYGQSVAPGVTDRNQMAAVIMQSLGLA